jgi:hypothetical protein
MTLSELGEGKFCLEFTKRGRRLGLRDGNGNPIRKLNIEHHKDGIVWVKSSGRIYTYGDPEYKESGAKPKVYSILPPPEGTKAEVSTAHEDLPIEERVEIHELAEGIQERERQQAVMDAIDSKGRPFTPSATKPKPTRKKKTEKAESQPSLTEDEERYNRFKLLIPAYPDCKVTEEKR